MHSTLKLRDSDPHDIFAITPEEVPVAWADKVLADIARDAKNDLTNELKHDVRSEATSPASDQPPHLASGAAAPTVDTTFRATATGDIPVLDDIPALVDGPPTSKWVKSAVMLVLAVGSAAAAVAWQNHGDTAKQMISNWVPTFALTSSPPTEKIGPAGQADTPAVQASAADQAPPQPAAPAQSQASATPAATAVPDTAQLQLMARDLAAMAQQIEQLKASIAELRASQHPTAHDAAKTSEAKPVEMKPLVQAARPRTPPPRSAAAPPPRPLPAYPPAQAAAHAPLPQPVPPPASMQPAPPQATARPDDEPIVRPPMPLR